MPLPWGAGPDDKMLPWGRRTRSKPLRTYTGTVIHKRKKHRFGLKDLTRVIDQIQPDYEAPDRDWLHLALVGIKELSLKMLDKVLFFLDEEQVRGLYDWIYTLLGKIFSIDTSYMMPHRSQYEDLIYMLASKGRLEITIKRL